MLVDLAPELSMRSVGMAKKTITAVSGQVSPSRLPEKLFPRGLSSEGMFATYYRTLRCMRLSQLLWRLRYTLERRRGISTRTAARWHWDRPHPPALPYDLTLPSRVATPARVEEQEVALLREGRFHLLNEERALGREHPDWRLGETTASRLWTITLHYHAWAYRLAEVAAGNGALASEAGTLFLHYLTSWMDRCALTTPGAGGLAWNAYAIATRLSWWVRSYLVLGQPWWKSHASFEYAFLASLWQQAAYLRDHLEWDLRANHLLRDAVGLAWAGRFFAEERAHEWLTTATRLAVEQAAEQVLPDGGHFERSPFYHLHVMEDVLSLALLLEDPAAREQLGNAWRAMAEVLCWLRHPDGDLALFNDGSLAGTDHIEHVLEAGACLGQGMDSSARRGGRHFPDTGLAVWHGQPWTVFFDVGPVGPDYQPGHAHADTLALECSYRGQRLFVDPGTFAYDNDDRRRYDRSTGAHNTICIDGQDSSEVWHIFRVGRRAYPRAVRVDFSGEGMNAVAAHTGYDHLPGRPRHTRQLIVADKGCLVLSDRIEGRGHHLLQGGLLLAPEWAASRHDSGWLLRNGPCAVRLALRGPDGLALSEERCPYHPEYGRQLHSTRLCWRVEGSLPVEVITMAEGG